MLVVKPIKICLYDVIQFMVIEMHWDDRVDLFDYDNELLTKHQQTAKPIVFFLFCFVLIYKKNYFVLKANNRGKNEIKNKSIFRE